MKLAILLIGLILLSGCMVNYRKVKDCRECNSDEFCKEVGGINWIFQCIKKGFNYAEINKTEYTPQFKLLNSSNLGIASLTLQRNPTNIEFYADKITFKDKELEITFIEFDSNRVSFLNFDDFDNLIWNIGNRTWTYKKEETNGR